VPDPKKCVEELATVVVTGGALSMTIYNKMSSLFERFNTFLRKISLRLPVKTIFLISHLFVPLLVFAWRWSGVKKRKIDWNERAHMIFNWLSSEFQNRTTNEEAADWFIDLGYHDIKFSDLPVGIIGIKNR